MKTFKMVLKILATILIGILANYVSLACLVLAVCNGGLIQVLVLLAMLILPGILPLIWLAKKKGYLLCYLAFILTFAILLGTQVAISAYEESLIINVTPNINTDEYLPFDEDSMIIKTDSSLLDFSNVPKEELPIIDGATAAFPVYSAFVHAVYPDSTELYDGVFEYNNTVGGYRKLAEKKTDIFIGAAPSKEQIAAAESNGTTFAYTQIGYEAFVFFVHKDNPVDSLTVEQIKGIYSGQITNWKEVGGHDEPIVAYQRNENSGSQSMLERFMGDTPIMTPPTEQVEAMMGGIIEQVSDYRSKPTSIGFSFRYYVEGIIQNPDIKLIAIDGVAPSVDNIRSNAYPIIAPVYAVTYEGNENPYVQQLIDWMLTDEGQYIIEQTGYVGIGGNAK